MKDRPFQLTDIVRETSYAIHRYHGCGHLEKVCENALVHRLRKLGLKVEQQRALTVCDEDGTVLGEYFADSVTAVQDASVSVNLVVSADVEQMNFCFGTFPRPNQFKDDAEVVTNGASPATIEITGKPVCPQRGMVWLHFKLTESGVQLVQ